MNNLKGTMVPDGPLPVTIALLAAWLLVAVTGGKAWQGIARLFGLGPGWDDILQGLAGLTVLGFIGYRTSQLRKRKEK